MSTQVDLFRQEFEKNRYNNNIDTSFSQFVASTPPSESAPPSVQEFFQYYQKLFYVIPKEGDINSHRYLINTSEAYIGASEQSDNLQALQEEITQLRRQLLEAQIGPAQAIAKVLSETGLNFPKLPEIPNLEIPTVFNPLGNTETTVEREKRMAERDTDIRDEEQERNRR
tara:strand:+ start:4246 stop:4755 length:510 start_codon:yes stop_codon:yes gene_type:complete